VTSSTSVTVKQTLTSIKVSPSSTTVSEGGQVAFSATALDQFAIALATQPTFTWKLVSGPGKMSNTGVYTAPTTRTGTATVQASAGGRSGRATVKVLSSTKTTNRTAATIDYLGSWLHIG